jgi:hypothetical protein
MRQLCISRDGLTRAAPVHADDARLLLQLVSAADELAELDSLASVSLLVTGSTVVLRLGAVEIEGRQTRSQRTESPGSVPQLDARHGLVVLQIRAAGQPLLRAVG